MEVSLSSFAYSSKLSEAVFRRCSVEKLFLEISQNSQETNCARASFLEKRLALRPATLLKKRLWHRCFPVNFVKFVRTPFLQNTSGGCFLTVKTVSNVTKISATYLAKAI